MSQDNILLFPRITNNSEVKEMSCTVERFLYQYDLNQEPYQRECNSLEEALELACEHFEQAQAFPKAILTQGQVVMNLNDLSNEWMQRHYCRLSHSKPDGQ